MRTPSNIVYTQNNSIGNIIVSCSQKVKLSLNNAVDGFQMSIKCPSSGGQACDQAAVQQTFHLERSSFFYLSSLMVRTRCIALTSQYYAHRYTKHPCPLEVKPRPMKISIMVCPQKV